MIGGDTQVGHVKAEFLLSEDTDAAGVVYYANYLVWFEVARADLLRTLGWTYREMEESGVSLPVIDVLGVV